MVLFVLGFLVFLSPAVSIMEMLVALVLKLVFLARAGRHFHFYTEYTSAFGYFWKQKGVLELLQGFRIVANNVQLHQILVCLVSL